MEDFVSMDDMRCLTKWEFQMYCDYCLLNWGRVRHKYYVQTNSNDEAYQKEVIYPSCNLHHKKKNLNVFKCSGLFL